MKGPRKWIGFVALLALLGIGTQAQEQKQPAAKDQHIQVKVDALLRQMTLIEDRAVKPDSWDSISGGAEARGSDRAGVGFFGAVGFRSKRDQPVAAHRSGKDATAYPITDWIGCRAGIPHDFS